MQFVSILTNYLTCREQDREQATKNEDFENNSIDEESFEDESFDQLEGKLNDVMNENEQLKNDVDVLTKLNDVYRTLNSDFAKELNQTKMKLKIRVRKNYYWQ